MVPFRLVIVCFVPTLILVFSLLPRPVRADERLAGIACRSVHLQYQVPEGTAFYNEVTVAQSAEGTYFCVCGVQMGYFGMQELADGKKVVIFSVWDPGDQNDPDSVGAKDRVKLLRRDDAVRVGRFGNEGTGGQSFFDYDWKVGRTYRFLVTGGDTRNVAAHLQSLVECRSRDPRPADLPVK